MCAILICIFILLLIIILCYYNTFSSQKNIYENFGNLNNVFLSQNQTQEFLQSDLDNYITNFNQTDLKVRKVNSIDVYLEKISNSARSFTKKEKKYLNKIAQISNNQITNMNISFNQILLNIPFTFAKTVNNKYENGFAHTRKNIIFLSSSFFNLTKLNAIKTIIHEKIHIFQRFYPTETDNYLKSIGFQKIRNLTTSEINNKRSNPDINNELWLDPNNKPMLPFFINNPKSMNDIVSKEKNQHPFEYMAYNIENLI